MKLTLIFRRELVCACIRIYLHISASIPTPSSILGDDTFDNPNFIVKYIAEATQGKTNILSYYLEFSELNKMDSFPARSIFFHLSQTLAALSLV